MFKHILVPTDGSKLSLNAIRRALSFARNAGAKITFFYSQQAYPKMYAGSGAIFDNSVPGSFRERQEALAQEILDAAMKMAREADVDCASATLSGDRPYETIIRAAQAHGCDLIFMASHGRRGVDALLLGSETQRVLTHSKIPVLVYR